MASLRRRCVPRHSVFRSGCSLSVTTREGFCLSLGAHRDTTKGTQTDMANSGSTRKPGTGNRRPPGTGNRSAQTRRSGAPATTGSSSVGATSGTSSVNVDDKLSAEERARERLNQPRSGGAKKGPQGAPVRGKRPPPKRAKQRSTTATAGIFGGAFVVLAVAVILVIASLGTGKAAPVGSAIAFAPAPASITSALANVTPQQLAAAGLSPSASSIASVFAATPGQKSITDSGKPVLVYMGAEYCPYCAAARWPLTIALLRFGKFTGLGTVGSSASDVYANTHTFSYWHATYSSSWLVFQSTEFESNVCTAALVSGNCSSGYKQLQAASKANSTLFGTYDTEKYFPQDAQGGATSGWIPFLDWGGKFVESGGLYNPGLINPGSGSSGTSAPWHPLSWQKVIDTFKVPTAGPGQAILSAANVYTAAICEMTGNNPGSVCSTSIIKTAEGDLPK